MTVIAVYWIFLLTTLGVGWALGAADTRRGIAMIMAATVGTMITQATLDQSSAQIAILGIDGLLLAYFVVLALRSPSFWPMWFSAMCGVGVLANFAAFVFPEADLAHYQNYAGFWAIPALLSLVVGVIMDSRAQSRARVLLER